MSGENEQDWGNYWQGRTSGDALVGVGVEHNETLIQFWTSCFEPLANASKVLDMACGAGSVLSLAHEAGLENLTGVDISADAIQTMSARLPHAKGIVSPVDKTGLPGQSFDWVVSQFGFEYAGTHDQVLASATEMARLIAPSGGFTALCHIVGGSIEQEVIGHLKDIVTIEQMGFVEAAKTIFLTAFEVEEQPNQVRKTAYEQAVKNLSGPRDQLVNWIGEHQQSDDQMAGLATHLYNGTLEMFSRRKAYVLDDILGWLGGMEHEIKAYKGRMDSMKRAALNEQEVKSILDVFKENGFTVALPETLALETSGQPAAWVLRASR